MGFDTLLLLMSDIFVSFTIFVLAVMLVYLPTYWNRGKKVSKESCKVKIRSLSGSKSRMLGKRIPHIPQEAGTKKVLSSSLAQ